MDAALYVAVQGCRCVVLAMSRLTPQDAYYCAECTRLEKDRDGCPKAANLGGSRLDSVFNRKRQGCVEYCRYALTRSTFQRG